MKHAIYDTTNGRIDSVFSGPTDLAGAQLAEGQNYTEIKQGNDAKHYINLDTQKPNKRDTSPATPSKTSVVADGVETVALSQMRAGTAVSVSGPEDRELASDGQTLRLAFTIPGTYTITATAPFPALPKTITITATPDLPTRKARATREINALAGSVRLAYITDVPGQSATYDDKLADCQAWLAETSPDIADHPWVAAVAIARGLDHDTAAHTVVDTYTLWRTIGIEIEQARETANVAIGSATDHAAVDTAQADGAAALNAYVA